MTGPELTQRMIEVGLTVDQLSAVLGTHPDEVRGWMTIGGRLPSGLARELAWVLALHERDQLMERSGLPHCTWMEAHAAQTGGDSAAIERRMAQADAHVASCEVCRRREAYAAKLPPLPPMPLPLHVGLLVRVAEAVKRLPGWARPAATGALILGAMTIARTLLMIVLRPSAITPQLLLTVVGAIALGAYGGLVGGVAYTLARGPTRRFGRTGDYLTGLACAYAYLAAFGLPAAIFTHDEMFRSSLGWISMLVVGTLFGLLVGHKWFRSGGDASGGA